MGEREVRPVNTSSSGRDNIGERYTGRLAKRGSPSINSLEDSKRSNRSSHTGIQNPTPLAPQL
jgi:hypothetical protein